MKNNIKAILKQKEISIRRLSIGLGKPYSFTHDLVNRESLAVTQLSTLVEVADFLGVYIEDLYSKRERS